jgi:hypothetical protein
MTKFADQLYADLMREHGHALRSLPEPSAAPRRRGARPARLTAGIAAATGAVAGGFVLFGGAAAPAYAVTQNADGTLSVSVKQASAIDAANATLKAMGVKVVVVPVRAGCPNLGSLAITAPRTPQTPDTRVSVAVSGHNGAVDSITVDAKGVPSDETLVLAFENAGGGVFGGSALVKGAAPSCVSLSAPTAPGAPPAPGAPGAPGLGGSSGSNSSSGSSGSSSSSGSGTTRSGSGTVAG